MHASSEEGEIAERELSATPPRKRKKRKRGDSSISSTSNSSAPADPRVQQPAPRWLKEPAQQQQQHTTELPAM
eukprot:1885230-Amphidinium_carterae.1